MKKLLLILLAGSLVLMAGCDLFEGPAGISGNVAPGGTIEINEPDLTPDSTALVIFDPDEKILDGDETIVTIPLSAYIIEGTVRYKTTWYAPEVVPGNYYVYYFIDIDGDGIIDSGREEETLRIFNDSTNAMTFDPPVAVTSIVSEGILLPNYTVWEDFAPQLDIQLGIVILGPPIEPIN